jgi:hypothetical protein
LLGASSRSSNGTLDSHRSIIAARWGVPRNIASPLDAFRGRISVEQVSIDRRSCRLRASGRTMRHPRTLGWTVPRPRARRCGCSSMARSSVTQFV